MCPATTPTADFALARYNPNGSLDTTFSGDGKQTTDFGPFDLANGVAIQANGKIVVVGYGGSGGANDFALARYNPNGSLDTTFSGDGKQTTDFGGTDQASGVAIQANGKIVVVGPVAPARTWSTATSPSPATTPTAPSTRPSPGTASRRPTSGPRRTGEGTGVALQADGKIVAVGATGGTNPNGGDSEFALARYNPNGTLDTTFSGDGKQTTEFGGDDGAVGWRSRREEDRRGGGRRPQQRLRARPLRRERLARPELLRRRQAANQFRGRRWRARDGSPRGWQDRRGRLRLRHRSNQRFRGRSLSGG